MIDFKSKPYIFRRRLIPRRDNLFRLLHIYTRKNIKLARRYPFTLMIICSNYYLYWKYRKDYTNILSVDHKKTNGDFFTKSFMSMVCPRNKFELYLNTFLLLYVGRRFETLFHSWNFLNMMLWCFVFTCISRLPGQSRRNKDDPYVNSNLFSISLSCGTALWLLSPMRTQSRMAKVLGYSALMVYIFSEDRDYDLRQGFLVGAIMKNVFLFRYNLYA